MHAESVALKGGQVKENTRRNRSLEDTIQFELCRLSLEVGKVFEQAARKLDLELGTFKLKYLGEDGCEILLASEDDFQYCSESQTAKGKTCIQFFLHLKSK